MELKTLINVLSLYVLGGVVTCVYARMLADTDADGSVSEAEYDAKMASGLFRLFSPVNAFMKLVFGYIWPFPDIEEGGEA